MIKLPEGEGVVIPIEGRDELSSALLDMTKAASSLFQSFEKVNTSMQRFDKQTNQSREDSKGFFGALENIYGGLR